MKGWILAAVFALSLTQVSFADPKIFIPEMRWDFGHVPPESKLTHDYWVKNTGTDTLKIIRVKPG